MLEGGARVCLRKQSKAGNHWSASSQERTNITNSGSPDSSRQSQWALISIEPKNVAAALGKISPSTCACRGTLVSWPELTPLHFHPSEMRLQFISQSRKEQPYGKKDTYTQKKKKKKTVGRAFLSQNDLWSSICLYSFADNKKIQQ